MSALRAPTGRKAWPGAPCRNLLAAAQFFVITAHQVGELCGHRIAIDGHQRLAGFAARQFFVDPAAHFHEAVGNLGLDDRPIRLLTALLEFDAHFARVVPGGGDFVAQVRQIKNFLDVSQPIGPLDKCLAGDGPVRSAVAALLARLVEKVSRLPATRAGLIARLSRLILLVRRWLLPGRSLLSRVGGRLTFSFALALALRVLSGLLALSLALALALALPWLGRRSWFLACGIALR